MSDVMFSFKQNSAQNDLYDWNDLSMSDFQQPAYQNMEVESENTAGIQVTNEVTNWNALSLEDFQRSAPGLCGLSNQESLANSTTLGSSDENFQQVVDRHLEGTGDDDDGSGEWNTLIFGE